MPKIVGGGRPFPPEICVQSDPPPFKQRNFDQYRLIAPQLFFSILKYVRAISCKKFTFAISSPDEFLFHILFNSAVNYTVIIIIIIIIIIAVLMVSIRDASSHYRDQFIADSQTSSVAHTVLRNPWQKHTLCVHKHTGLLHNHKQLGASVAHSTLIWGVDT